MWFRLFGFQGLTELIGWYGMVDPALSVRCSSEVLCGVEIWCVRCCHAQ